MPYAYAGHCYATTTEGLEAFRQSFPQLIGGYFVSHVSSSVNASGVVSYTMAERQAGSNIVNNRSSTFTLAPCTTAETTPVFDPIAAGGIFAFFFIGVAGSWYLVFAYAGMLTAWATIKGLSDD